MSKKTYTVVTNAIITARLTVEASSEAEAREIAEENAAEIFDREKYIEEAIETGNVSYIVEDIID